MKVLLALTLFIFAIEDINANSVIPLELNPDVKLNITQMAKKHGYRVETYEVTTEDGYILMLNRIPRGKNECSSKNVIKSSAKPAVLLMHGLLSNAVDFINMGSKSLGYRLADEGYDVWLGNQRGNTWSKKHVTLDPVLNASTFFDFSFNEIGKYDLPAKIDFILEKTGQESLFYIGHSQGTSDFFAMAALRPEYNKKIKLMHALAPIAYLGNIINPLFKILSKYVDLINIVVKAGKIYEFLPYNELYYELGKALCVTDSEYHDLCNIILGFIGGYDDHMDLNIMPVLLSNLPAGAAAKQLIHFLQEIKSEKFSQYDYGPLNLLHYGTLTPPDYDISNITAPISLHYSKNDFLGTVEDVEKFAKQLPNLKTLRLVPRDEFNHLDFIWAYDAPELLFDFLIEEMNSMR